MVRSAVQGGAEPEYVDKTAEPPPPRPLGGHSGSLATLARRSLVMVGVAVAVVVALLVLWFARDVLLLVFAGVLLAVFLRRLATLVSDLTHLPPTWGLVVVVLVLVGSIVGTFVIRGPAITSELRALRTELPQAAAQLKTQLADYDWGQRVIDAAPDPSELLPDQRGAVAQATGVLSRTFSAATSFAVILFVGIVMAGSPDPYRRGVLALLPARHVARGREVLDRLYDTLWWWLLGRLISMTIIGVTTTVGLWLLGVPLAFVLGFLAALLSFIPNVGPILSAVPAVLLAFAQGPRHALWVVLLYAGVQTIESFALAPIIDRKTISLPPAFTIVAQLVLAAFGGLLGVALATPLAAVAVVLVTLLYVQDVLGRRDIELSGH